MGNLELERDFLYRICIGKILRTKYVYNFFTFFWRKNNFKNIVMKKMCLIKKIVDEKNVNFFLHTSDSFWTPATRLVWNPRKNQCRSAVKSVVEPGMVCTTPSNATSWRRGRCVSRDITSHTVLVFHDVVAGPESGLAWYLALDRVKCAIKLLWKIISMVLVWGILELKLDPRHRVYVEIPKPSRVSLKLRQDLRPTPRVLTTF
jgi:hypothetical protein